MAKADNKVVGNVTEENVSTNLAVVEGDSDFAMLLQDLDAPKAIAYCSFKPKTAEEQKWLFNVTNTPEERLKDHINETISVRDVYIEIVRLINQETGEFVMAPRIVLIDKNNIGYTCVSVGIFNVIKKLWSSAGDPSTWTAPIDLKVKQITKDKKSILTLEWV